MTQNILEILSNSKLFEGIPTSEISILFKKHPFLLDKYPSGNIVVLSGEPCNHLMIMLTGSIKGEMIEETGKVIKVEEIKAPNPFAHAFLFAHDNKFPVTVTTLEKSEMLSIEKAVFTQMLQENTQLLGNFLALISDKSRFLSQKVIFLAFKTIKKKLAIFIMKRASEQQSNNITLTETQQELAEYFGVTRPALARSLSVLEEEGIIKMNKKHIEIKNLIALKDLSILN